MGPGSRSWSGVGRGVRRPPEVPTEVSRLRAARASLGADRRADAEAPRDRRPGGRRTAPPRPDGRVESVPRTGHGPPSSGQPRASRSAHSVWRADGRWAAVVRHFHERGDGAPFLLRALPRQPAARGVWVRGRADSAGRAASVTLGEAVLRAGASAPAHPAILFALT